MSEETGKLMRGVDGTQRLTTVGGEAASSELSIPTLLWQGRWWIVAGALLGAAVGGYVLSNQTPTYESSSRIYIQEQAGQVMGDAWAARSNNYIQTQVEIMRSTPLLSEASERLGQQYAELLGEQVDNLVGWIRAGLVITRDDGTDLVTVSYHSSDPQLSAVVVNTVVETFIDDHEGRQRQGVAEVLGSLQEEKRRRETELRERYQKLVRFWREHEMLYFEQEEGGDIVTDRLATLSNALTEAELRVVEAQTRQEALLQQYEQAEDGAGLRQLIRAGTFEGGQQELAREARLRERISELQHEMQQLQRNVTANHPTLSVLRDQMSILKQELATQQKQLGQAILEHAQQELQMARQQADSLREAYESQRSRAMGLGEASAEQQMLESEVRRLERLLDILDNRIKEIDVSQEVGRAEVQLVEVARPAESPTGPGGRQTMAMMILFGAAVGAGGAYLRIRLDQRLHHSEEVAALLNTPLLATIPNMRRVEPSKRTKVVAEDPFSGPAEAFRMLRTAIYFDSAEHPARTMVVTSPDPGDGKSTLISNLAIAMSQAGDRVLLMGCDFRQPSQYGAFGIDQTPGVTEALSGDTVAEDLIVASGVGEGQLDVLPCGTIPPNPAELLGSRAFGQLLEQLGQQYDRILIDAPPVLPVADATILSGRCDAVLLLLRADRSTRRHSRRAVESLLSVGASLRGIAFNAETPKGSGYSRYGRYGRGGYGYAYRPRAEGNGEAEKHATVSVGVADSDMERSR